MSLSLIYDRTLSTETRTRTRLPPPPSRGGGDDEFFVEDLEATIGAETEKRTHQLIIREFPTWIEPPKTGAENSRRLSQTAPTTAHLSARPGLGQGQGQGQLLEVNGNGISNPNYQQLVVNHLGSVHYDQIPGESTQNYPLSSSPSFFNIPHPSSSSLPLNEKGKGRRSGFSRKRQALSFLSAQGSFPHFPKLSKK